MRLEHLIDEISMTKVYEKIQEKQTVPKRSEMTRTAEIDRSGGT